MIRSITEHDPTKTISHDLLLRGSFIRQSSAGLYTFLPLGARVLDKLQAIIDSAMSSIDGQKVSMPNLLHSEKWKMTKRWNMKQMFKLKDRNSTDFLLAPTHEEEVTALVASLVSSYRQLPLKVYQIGIGQLTRQKTPG